MKKRVTYIIVFLLFSTFSFAQKFSVKASLDSNQVKIGEQVRLILDLEQAKGVFVQFPELKDTIFQVVEILEQSKVDTLQTQGKQLHLQQKLLITAYEEGNYWISPFEFITKRNGQLDTLKTNSLLFEVHTVVVDTTKNIKAIKQPIETPLTLSEFLSENYPYILGTLVVILLIAGAVFYYKRRQKNQPLIKIRRPKEAAHVVARRQLNQLQAKKLWQNNKIKAYHSELSEIIRIYLEERFQIPAMEQVSDEILERFSRQAGKQSKGVNIKKEHYEMLSQILQLADFVKFAKLNPLANENELSMNNAYTFVEKTIPIVLVKNQKE